MSEFDGTTRDECEAVKGCPQTARIEVRVWDKDHPDDDAIQTYACPFHAGQIVLAAEQDGHQIATEAL